MRSTTVLGALGALAQLSRAVPTPTENGPSAVAPRQLGQMAEGIRSLGDFGSDGMSQANGGNIINNLLNDFKLIQATVLPTSIPAAASALVAIVGAAPTPRNYVGLATDLIGAGLTTDNVGDLLDFAGGVVGPDNSFNNNNPRQPSVPVYPRADKRDAPYSVPEAQLRGAIRIPSSFQYGQPGAPQPIILVPGTGGTGYTTFIGNYIPLLQGSNIADPVWLNIPGFQLNDAQVNAEYVAYAINYIYGITNKCSLSVAAWSQGSLSTQWTLKYWPSTRPRVTDLIAFSPDYAGTINANFLATGAIPLPPSLVQQQAGSNFIQALRSSGGDSAYVPTTNIYSSLFDEIVQPQTGPSASGALRDTRDVGATNHELQQICPGQPAGSLYTHEGVLFNPLGYALLVDALAHDGPGRVSRIRDLRDGVCTQYLAPGLDLADLLLTENTIAVAGATILTYPQPVVEEPAVFPYAR